MAAKEGARKKHVDRIPRFIDETEILRFVSGKGWYIGERKLSKDEVVQLQQDAKVFSESHLWRLMRKDIHYFAYVKATNKATTAEDIYYANAMYKNLEMLEQFMNNCATLS